MSINGAVNIQTELEDVHQGQLTIPALFFTMVNYMVESTLYAYCLAVVEKNQPGSEVIRIIHFFHIIIVFRKMELIEWDKTFCLNSDQVN